MRITVRSVTESSDKFVRRASQAGEDYKAGVSGAGQRWQSAATAANTTYVQGVTAAANAGRFAAGVQKAGGARYEKNAVEKGAVRFGPGVAAAQNDYAAGVQPYLAALGNLDLPPRQVRGSEGNMARVSAVARALRTLKTGGK